MRRVAAQAQRPRERGMGEVLRPEACALGGLGSEDEHARRLRDASGELQRQGSSMHTESGGVVSSSVYLRVCVVYLRPFIFGVSSVYLRVYLRVSQRGQNLRLWRAVTHTQTHLVTRL